jgi:hypothetical protein
MKSGKNILTIKNMDTSIILKDMKIKSVWFDTQKIHFDFKDGRTMGSPLNWFPRLKNVSET